jgi:hypothetical protein
VSTTRLVLIPVEVPVEVCASCGAERIPEPLSAEVNRGEHPYPMRCTGSRGDPTWGHLYHHEGTGGSAPLALCPACVRRAVEFIRGGRS